MNPVTSSSRRRSRVIQSSVSPIVPSASRLHDTEDEAGPSASYSSSAVGEPWWTGTRSDTQNGKGRETPYRIRTVLTQSGGPIGQVCQCVEFFPFTGPMRPEKTRNWRSWDKWEDTAVYCLGSKVIIGRCRDDSQDACWESMGQVSVQSAAKNPPVEELYHVTWTIDPFTFHPIVIAGGKLGLLYVIDIAVMKTIRILKGHGDQVQALAICPSMPHILASGSRDHTIRIWNLYGHAVELKQGELPNQDYPMGDADEGNHIVAILCGNWPGGHMDDVCAIAWHPRHRAVATSSRDQSFKIWALPELPPPRVPKPARDYRPVLVSWPLFSTNRLADATLDSIHWLNEDIIVVRTLDSIITFQWLSYRRYFERDTWGVLGDTVMPVPDPAHWHDIDDSRSFMVISNCHVDGYHTYHRTGFHTAFVPFLSEKDTFNSNPNLVQDYLIAIPRAGVMPEILLYAPTLAPPNPKPHLDIRERKDVRDFDNNNSDDGEDEGEEDGDKLDEDNGVTAKKGISGMDPLSNTGGMDNPIEVPDEDVDVDSSDMTDSEESEVSSDESSDSNDGEEDVFMNMREGEKERVGPSIKKKARRKRCRWYLKVPVWEDITKKHNRMAAGRRGTVYTIPEGSENTSVITCCAISPRGAKWVLGVGQAGSVFIWRLNDSEVE